MGSSLKTYLNYARPSKRTRRARTLFVTAVATLALIAAPFATAFTNHSSVVVTPESMASVGDSISNRPVDAESWTTGTLPSVNSIHTRLETGTGRDVAAYQQARSGADSSVMVSQMSAAINSGADLVTVLIGANDLCASNTSGITSVATFQARYAEVLKMANDAGVKTVAVSIPSLNQLWEVGKESRTARLIWDFANICQTALGDPLSTDADDVARRALVAQRNTEYNAVIEAECAKYVSCASDNGAVYATEFTISDLSRRDFFHPNEQGQAKLAAAVWPAVESLYPGQFGDVSVPTPVTPTPTTPKPSEPTTPINNATTKNFRFKSPINVDLRIKKVEITVNGKTYTGTVVNLGSGEYRVKVDTAGQTLSNGAKTAHVKAYGAEGNLLYEGTISLRVRD